MLKGLNHLSLAVSDLASRLLAWRDHPYAGMRFYSAD